MDKPITFDFSTANRILFGNGTLKEAGLIAAGMGKKALIVGGKTPARASKLMEYLQKSEVNTIYYSIPEEPTVDMVQGGMDLARNNSCDVIIGFGGGSAMDAAKAIAILLANPGEIYDYLEVIGKGKPYQKPALPFIAIPTTAGTGSEVTRNAVVASPKDRVKVSLRHAWLLPRVAIIDPELTYDCPPQTTAFSGMDALIQVVEPFLSPKANPFTDSICREGIERAARSLVDAYRDGHNAAARQDMAIASLFGGIALANAGLGAVHGFSGVMGGMYPIPHGALCASLFPYVTEVNVRALEQRQPSHPSLARYTQLAPLLTGKPDATLNDAIHWMYGILKALGIPRLSDFNVKESQIDEIVQLSKRSSSMKANPIVLTDDELKEILTNAI